MFDLCPSQYGILGEYKFFLAVCVFIQLHLEKLHRLKSIPRVFSCVDHPFVDTPRRELPGWIATTTKAEGCPCTRHYACIWAADIDAVVITR